MSQMLIATTIIKAPFGELQGRTASLTTTLIDGKGGDWDMNNALQWEETVSGLDVVGCMRHLENWRPKTRFEWLSSQSLEDALMHRTPGKSLHHFH